MPLVLTFAVTLFGAVLVSERARRSVVSTAVLFLVTGFAVGALGWLPKSGRTTLEVVAEASLVVTLFTDAAKLPVRELATSLRLPGRALLLGMPLTLLATALLARLVVGLTWKEAFLVGAVLSPTDPVFAASLVGSEHVPERLRRMLNIESGLNDALAVPAVLVLIQLAGGRGEEVPRVFADLGFGIAIGALVPIVAVWLYRQPFFAAADQYKPVFAGAVLLMVWSAAKVLGANEFLACFAAGCLLATVSEKAQKHWEAPGETLSELAKLVALLVLGTELSSGFFGQLGWRSFVFAASALFVARPLALFLSLFRARLPRAELIAAAWFGPRGFASVIFALFVLKAEVPHREGMFRLVALVVVASVLLHASTDSLVANWFERSAARDHDDHVA